MSTALKRNIRSSNSARRSGCSPGRKADESWHPLPCGPSYRWSNPRPSIASITFVSPATWQGIKEPCKRYFILGSLGRFWVGETLIAWMLLSTSHICHKANFCHPVLYLKAFSQGDMMHQRCPKGEGWGHLLVQASNMWNRSKDIGRCLKDVPAKPLVQYHDLPTPRIYSKPAPNFVQPRSCWSECCSLGEQSTSNLAQPWGNWNEWRSASQI